MLIKRALLFVFILSNLTFAGAVVSQAGIQGRVYDIQTGKNLDWVDLFIVELNRSASTLREGHFYIPNLPEGEYTLTANRIGYSENHFHIHIVADSVLEVELPMFPEAFETEAIVVEDHRTHSHLQQPDVEMQGKELRRNLAGTLAETISNEPGLDFQSNGPAPARPVLRGLSGDRLLLLENGERTGDLSTTSSDHAVTIEPINAERIEVVRGPKTLEYGSNTLSGVINVQMRSNAISDQKTFTAQASSIAETVNRGYATAINFALPINAFTFYGDGSFRKSGDISTPAGKLKNTFIETFNGFGTLSWRPSWGKWCISSGTYVSSYGIPPSPPDLGHPNGVDINLKKGNVKSQFVVEKPIKQMKNLEIKYDYTYYFHEELSGYSSSTSNKVIKSQDAAFRVQTQHAALKSNLEDFWIFKNSTFGLWSEFRAFEAGGRTATINSKEQNLAAFTYHEWNAGPLMFSASARLENKIITPETEKYDLRVGHIRQRKFTDFAASLKSELGLTKSLRAGLTLIRAFRAPGIEELYSDGPHLASYAYEVGNADLEQERTYGLELSTTYEGNRLNLTTSAYYNRIDGYLFSQNTGERSWRRYDLYRYHMVGLDARIRGLELNFVYQLTSKIKVSNALSLLQGDLLENWYYKDPDNIIPDSLFTPYKANVDEPLPFMPPLKGRVGLEYNLPYLSVIYEGEYAAKQDRPGRFENVTDGFFIHNLTAEVFITTHRHLHTIAFSAENVLNTTYRRHLNRIKDIFPEPGRNFKIIYKIYI